jgi:hypothetical protein
MIRIRVASAEGQADLGILHGWNTATSPVIIGWLVTLSEWSCRRPFGQCRATSSVLAPTGSEWAALAEGEVRFPSIDSDRSPASSRACMASCRDA